MAGKGGARVGAGRKTKSQEDRIRSLAVAAIKGKYGSEQDGFKFLLQSTEPTLIKFVFEHAFGKPKEKIEHSGNPESPVIFQLDERFTKEDS